MRLNDGSIDQKWVVVDSREMHASKAKTFDKRINREFTESRKSLKKLGRVLFACEADARKAADRWLLENPHFILQNLKIKVVCRIFCKLVGPVIPQVNPYPWINTF